MLNKKIKLKKKNVGTSLDVYQFSEHNLICDHA